MENNLEYNKKFDKDIYYILYWLALGIIISLWTEPETFPPMMYRLGMIGAIFAPVLFVPRFIPFVSVFFLLENQLLCTKYTYLPSELMPFVGIMVFCIVCARRNLFTKEKLIFVPLFAMVLHWLYADLCVNGTIGTYIEKCIPALLIALYVKEKQEIHYLSAALILVCTFLAIYYFLLFDKFLILFYTDAKLERSGWSDPNYFASTLGVGYVVCLMYLSDVLKSKIKVFFKPFLILCCICIAVAIVMTASRGGFISISLATLVTILVSNATKKWRMLSIAVIVMVLYVMLLNGMFEVLLFRFFEQGNMDTAGERTYIWNLFAERIQYVDKFGFLFGFGFGHRFIMTDGWDMHNEFLSIFADYGVMGEVLFLTVLIALVAYNRYNWKALIIPLVFFFLACMSVSPFQYPYISIFLVFIILVQEYSVKPSLGSEKYPVCENYE